MIAVTSGAARRQHGGACSAISAKSSVPSACQIRNIAIRKPKSPIRFMMNAFLPASALALSLNQKPISR